jgi:hypothetical protein
MFVEWTIHDQLRRIQFLERSKGGKTSKGGKSNIFRDYEGVNLNREDEDDIQTNAMA